MLSDRDRKMSDQCINWKNEIGVIAGPFLPHDTKLSWLQRASLRCGLSFRHIQSLYYGKVTDPKYSVASKIINAAGLARIQEAKRDAEVVAKFFNNHAQALANVDPDIHRSEINAFVEAARIVSGRNSA